MPKTDFEWQGETRYISSVTDKGGIVPEMNNDKATFIRYCMMQKVAAEKDGFYDAVTTIQHCIDDLTGA